VATFQPTIATVFYLPETKRFGFSYAFEGKSPHYAQNGCLTLQDALDHCDPHREHVWEDPSDGKALLVSRGYKEGSVMWRMTHFTVAELVGQRMVAL
jgi:hypothetical protein